MKFKENSAFLRVRCTVVCGKDRIFSELKHSCVEMKAGPILSFKVFISIYNL